MDEDEYIAGIVSMLWGCKDVALLDLIFQLLKKEGYANTWVMNMKKEG